jgi:hypothetical protein
VGAVGIAPLLPGGGIRNFIRNDAPLFVFGYAWRVVIGYAWRASALA